MVPSDSARSLRSEDTTATFQTRTSLGEPPSGGLDDGEVGRGG